MMRRIAWTLAGCLCAVLAIAQDVPDAEAQRRWVGAHPVLRIALDPQLRADVGVGNANPLVTGYLALSARQAGMRFETVRTASWAESVAAFKAHRVDVLPSTSDRLLTADLGTSALLSSPFYVGRTLIVTRTVGPATMDLWHLQGRTVAFKGGGQYEAWLQREHPSITRLPLADIHQILAAVESGIADAAIGIDVAYYPIVRRDYAQSLRVAGTVPEMAVSVRVAVQRDQPVLLSILEQSMRGLSTADNEAVIERWLETAYLRAPTWSQVLATYRVEIGLGAALVAALVFALWQLRRAQLASRRGEQQKTMLLAVMSHEVRNAVNAVTSSIDLMARQPQEGPQRDLLAIAQVSSRNLQNLLKSALDYTRSEVEGFTPDPVPCDVQAVAREAIASQRLAIEAKGLEVRLDMPMGPLPWLLVDEVRVRQLLENLFANAVKFTERGHVGIALWQGAGDDPDGVRRLVIEVFDTGIGVSSSRQRQLFVPFAQARGRLDVRLGGTGLGLAICRDIATHLGGRLAFNSEAGVGTSVRVELPTSLVPTTTPVPATAASDERLPERAGGVVLLVEDHPANRQIIAAQLKFLGYATEAVDHGQAAIDTFVPGRFTGVLLDCELPDMQGYDIAAELRAREIEAGVAPTRFVAISANQGVEHVRRCAQSGIDTVLGKPLSLDALTAALATPVRTPVEHGNDTPAAAEALHATFRRETRHDLVAVREALADGDLPLARHHVHRARGAALVCGVEAIVTLAGELEDILDAGGDADEAQPVIEAMVRHLREG
jgi:signal transduction histidine kinase/CheY-like chemotaxis protein